MLLSGNSRHRLTHLQSRANSVDLFLSVSKEENNPGTKAFVTDPRLHLIRPAVRSRAAHLV